MSVSFLSAYHAHLNLHLSGITFATSNPLMQVEAFLKKV